MNAQVPGTVGASRQGAPRAPRDQGKIVLGERSFDIIDDDGGGAAEDQEENIHVLVEVLGDAGGRAEVDHVRLELARAAQRPDHAVGARTGMHQIEARRADAPMIDLGLDQRTTPITHAFGPAGRVSALIGHPGVLTTPGTPEKDG
jgi:hypothetical protein